MARNGTAAQHPAPRPRDTLLPPQAPIDFVPRVPPQPPPAPSPDDANCLDTEESALPHTPRQQMALVRLQQSIKKHLRLHARNAVVSSDTFVQFWRGPRVAPDVYVGLERPEEFSIEDTALELERGETLDFVLEMLSPSTADYDKQGKKELYRQHGVREYFLYQPNEALPGPDENNPGWRIRGFRLQDTQSPDIAPDRSGMIASDILGISLQPEGVDVRVYDTETGHRYRWAEEDAARAEQAEELAKHEAARAEQAEELAEQEKQSRARDAARYEYEIERLKQELRRERGRRGGRGG